MDKQKKMAELRVFAEEIRVAALKEFQALGFGHIGGAMSVIETLANLYGSFMKYDPKNPRMPERDWLIMSKGHAGPSLYATLALKGFFPMEELMTLNQGGTNLPSHCDRNKTIGVDMTTGSLGQGISSAIGIAYGNRLSGYDSTAYLIVGDGECDEGEIWEGVMLAPQLKLGNLICFVDQNKQQLDGWTKDVLDLGDMEQKWKDFGWHTQKVNGHDIEAVYDAIAAAKEVKDQPSMILLDTIKGNGCSFAETICPSHHLRFKPEQMVEALEIAEKRLADVKAAAAAL